MPAEMTDRRFPPPWTLDEHDECFIVRDADGQALAYVYFEEERDGAAARWRLKLGFPGEGQSSRACRVA